MKKETKKDVLFDHMAIAIGAYMKALGGTAVVVGPTSIGKDVGALKYRYYVRVEVTGKAPTKLSPHKN